MSRSFPVGDLPLRYRIERVLSRTERAATLQVFDDGIRQASAVVKLQRLSKDDRGAFDAYCSVLSGTDHAYVAVPYTHGLVDGSDGELYGYMTRNYVHGATLAELALPLGDVAVVQAAFQIATGLDALHSRGLMHQDLKLDNVVVRRSRSGSLDGLSQCVLIDLSYRPPLTGEQRDINDVTLQYVAPELLEGASATPRSDLYALGVLLYSLLVGQLPFAGHSIAQILTRQRSRRFPSIQHHRPDVSIGLTRLVESLLEPYVDNRPLSAKEVIARLHDCEERSDFTVISSYWSETSAFLGRAKELQQCKEWLGQRRHAAIEIAGPRLSGVTTFLREMQDQLEARGVVVLTAQPRTLRGSSLHEQLFDCVHQLVRRASTPRPKNSSKAASTTDLLDDLLVATKERQVVLFVDNWAECDVAEAGFLRRVVLQGQMQLLEGVAGAGNCQVVLGRSGDTDRTPFDVEARILLDPLASADVYELLQHGGRNSRLSRVDCDRVVESTGGQLPQIVQVLRRVEADTLGQQRGLDAILAECTRGTEDERDQQAALLVESPHGVPIAALALLGERIPMTRWQDLLRNLPRGPYGEGIHRFVEVSLVAGEEHVRSRHANLGGHLLAVLPVSTRVRIVDAVIESMRSMRRSDCTEELLSLLRFLARLGRVPESLRWATIRAVVLLMQRGRFADVESFASCVCSSTEGRASGWYSVFLLAAKVESGRPNSALPTDSEAESTSVQAAYRRWLLARGESRSRNRRRALESLRCLAHAFPWMLGAVEDYGVLAAEEGLASEATWAKRGVLVAIQRARAAAAGSSTRGSARLHRIKCRYFRLQHRVAQLGKDYEAAARAARRGYRSAVATSNVTLQASCLNNEAASLGKGGAPLRAIVVLEECARLREQLDDERGVVVVLNNLALAYSAVGRGADAIAALNRARLIAGRNGLDRHRNISALHLGTSYARRGQLRDARKMFARLVAGTPSDSSTLARALNNLCEVSLDCWYLKQFDRYLDDLRALRGQARSVHDAPPDLLAAELALRTQNWTAIAQLDISEEDKTYYSQLVENGVEVPRVVAQRRGLPAARRLRLLRVLWTRDARRIHSNSLLRIIRCAIRHASIREGLEWLARVAATRDVSVDVGLKTLSCPEFREGHDDLHIEIRTWFVARLIGEGRRQEAWSLLEDALSRFDRLERKLARWGPVARLEQLYQALRRAVGLGEPDEGSRRLSTILRASAFGLLKGRSIERDGTNAQVLRSLATLLAEPRAPEAIVDGLLEAAVAATGAQRALLINLSSRGAAVARSFSVIERVEGNEELSWAVVSEVARTGVHAVYNDALTTKELASHRSVAALRLRSLACVPVCVGGDTVGVLYLDHQGIAGLFHEEHLQVLRLFAAVIGMVSGASTKDRAASKWEEELKEAHRQLMRSERNRVAGELLSGVAHDLKNLLSAVVARSQLLLHAATSANDARSLRAIDTAAQAGARLIEKIQQCSREHGTEAAEHVDVAVMVHETLDLLAPRLSGRRGKDGQGIQVAVEAPPGAIIVAPPGEVREILLNLCVNACDAMPEGGTLRITVRVDGEQNVSMQVSDSGVGIPSSVLPRVFDPFFTTKGKRGTGLGLAVVQSIVVRLAGSVAVESQEGKGTCFKVTLPRSAKSNEGVQSPTKKTPLP